MRGFGRERVLFLLRSDRPHTRLGSLRRGTLAAGTKGICVALRWLIYVSIARSELLAVRLAAGSAFVHWASVFAQRDPHPFHISSKPCLP